MSGKTYWKIMLLMKRRPDMSVEDFRDYYENHHVPLVSDSMAPGIVRYMRRYLDPQPHAESGRNDELPYDVLTEVWFEDEALYRKTLEHVTTSVMADEVVEDEKQFLHRPTMRIATLVECETPMA